MLSTQRQIQKGLRPGAVEGEIRRQRLIGGIGRGTRDTGRIVERFRGTSASAPFGVGAAQLVAQEILEGREQEGPKPPLFPAHGPQSPVAEQVGEEALNVIFREGFRIAPFPSPHQEWTPVGLA